MAGVAVGGLAGVITLSKKSTADENCSDVSHTCNQVGVNANESGKTFAVLSSVGFGVGVLGLATGAYLYLTSKPAEPRSAHSSIPEGSSPQLSAELNVQSSSGFISIAGRF